MFLLVPELKVSWIERDRMLLCHALVEEVTNLKCTAGRFEGYCAEYPEYKEVLVVLADTARRLAGSAELLASVSEHVDVTKFSAINEPTGSFESSN